ncbi:MAG: sugar ABC transporter substrate-binding protein, partial [bacterium]
FPSAAQVAEDVRISGNIMYKAAVDTLSFGRLPPKFIGVSGWASGTVLPEFQKILVGDSTVENAVDRMIKGLEETL